MNTVLIVNYSKLVTDIDIERYKVAIQKQINEHFVPFWGTPATLVFTKADFLYKDTAWKVYLQDDLDQPNDLGYHEDSTGQPEAKVNVKACLDCRVPLSTVISHEVLEMLADPYTNRIQNNVCVEVCDPVSIDYYNLDGTSVANFVTPSWFGFDSSNRYDYMDYLKAPYPKVRPGGYYMKLEDNQWVTCAARCEDGALSPAMTLLGRSKWRASK